ncbi:MAG: relaxase domain-containing protein [Planctomycetaceae bacterium]|nr:relaxase domain-containing protein [Planctomycetaceae bacterium]
MLRIVQSTTPAAAKSYYSTADYYTEGQELAGVWRGQAASRLGLAGTVRQPEWDALCDNRDPRDGSPLTIRQKSNRRVGYDFNFHAPKSLSLAYGLTEDPRLLEALREAVDATMRDMEQEMQTRVRGNGANGDRTTRNMVWGEFVHTTARPVNGVPDPHLHAHCFVFNATWDDQEARWKAGQFAGLKRDASYFEAVFHSRLAWGLAERGFGTRRTRTGWELEGIDQASLAKFSRRTAEIEAKAEAKGITDPREKGALGARTREAKAQDLSGTQLRALWADRLTPEESEAVRAAMQPHAQIAEVDREQAVGDAARLALDHCLERSAVADERGLLARAMRNAYGTAGPDRVAQEVASLPLLRAERDGRRIVTTPAVLSEERDMIRFARDGRGTLTPLAAGPRKFLRDWLSADQRAAVLHVLGSRDRVTLVRGGAGTGKTSMLQEIADAMRAEGHELHVFAPSAEASRGVLRSEGFSDAETVARLLVDDKLQASLRGSTLWIDEAGLLSSRTTGELFRLADRIDARLVLAGDRRQHGSVERGATLRLLEEEAGLVPAELRDIKRQKGDYKRAVAMLAEGRTGRGLAELNRLGWVREAESGDRYRQLASDYVESVVTGKTALVVSPTHREGEWVTAAIRDGLRAAGKLGKAEHEVAVLTPRHLTAAERQDKVNYNPEDVIVFHQNARGFRKGERLAAADGSIPIDQSERFGVYSASTLTLAPGDLVRVTANGATADGKHRLNNGAVYSVHGFDARGDINLTNGWTIARDFGHLAYGYCVTSHASQGRTVDRVFIGMSSVSQAAISREQFYVSVSRGREQATIYTDDVEALGEAVSRSDERTTATDLIRTRRVALDRSPPVVERIRNLERAHG